MSDNKKRKQNNEEEKEYGWSYFYNADGTEDNDPKKKGYETWEKYYDATTRYDKLDICYREGCKQDGTDLELTGAHVHLHGTCKASGENKHYEMLMIKLCSGCNGLKGQLKTKSMKKCPFVRVDDQICDCFDCE